MNASSNDTFAWDPLAGAASYDWEVQNTSGLMVESGSTPDTTLPVTTAMGNRPFGAYQLVVRGVEAAGPGQWSAPFLFNFVSLPAPQNLRIL